MGFPASARKLAVALNLFYNFTVDASLFSRFEVVYTYAYLLAFAALGALLGVQYFAAAQQTLQCYPAPQYGDMCPIAFSMCICPDAPDPLVAHPCRTPRGFAGCTCCWYGAVAWSSGLPLFLTHLGGLYTFSMGVSIVFLGLVRACMRKAPDPPPPPDMCVIRVVTL